MHLQAKETSSEQLAPEIDQMIEGAKQAVQYFEWMLQANKATLKVIESQFEYASEQLKKLEDEKHKKYSENGRPIESLS